MPFRGIPKEYLDNRYVNITGDTMTGDLKFNDNVKTIFGTGSDYEISHDATDTIFRNLKSDSDTLFYVNDGGVDKGLMKLNGASGRVEFPAAIASTSPVRIGTACDLYEDTVGILRTSSALVVDSTITFENGSVLTDTGTANLFMGEDVGTSGAYSLFIGRNAGQYNVYETGVSGYYTTYIGYGSGKGVSAAVPNLGKYNLGLGFWTLRDNNTGGYNTAIGFQALRSNTVGITNTAIGSNALLSNIDGSHNMYFGYSAGYKNSTADYNIGIGDYTNYHNETGRGNTSIGYRAGQGVSGNSNEHNIFIGYEAGFTTSTGSDNIIIGYDIDLPTPTTSNYLSIGDLIKGDFSAGRVQFPQATSLTGSVNIGADVDLFRGEANVLYLGTGDSMYIPSGNGLKIGTGAIGIGADPVPSIALYTTKDTTTITGTSYGALIQLSNNPSANSVQSVYGIYSAPLKKGAFNLGALFGASFSGISYASGGTINYLTGVQASITLGGGAGYNGLVTNSRGVVILAPTQTASNGGAITNNYGEYIANQGGSFITNAYGLYIAATTGATAKNYTIYTTGGTHYLGGDVQMPNATSSGTGLLIGGDVELYRGIANKLYLGTGDSLNLVLGEYTQTSASTLPWELDCSHETTQFRINNTTAASTSNGVQIQLRGNTDVTERTMAYLTASYTDIVDATRTSRLRISTQDAGTYGAAFDIIGKVLKTYGGKICNTTRITGATTLDANHHIIFADTDGGAFTVSLPAGVEGTHYKIINCGSSGNDLTIAPDGTEQIYGSGAGTSIALIDGEITNLHYNATEGWW